MNFHHRRSSFHFAILLHFIFVPLAFTATIGQFVNLLVQNNLHSDENIGSSASSVSVECKEPLMGSNSWECGIMEESIWGGNSSSNDGAWEELEQEERNLAQQQWGNRSSDEILPQIRAGPIQLFYSNKVNRSTGQLFISAFLRCDFDSQFFHSAYKVFLRIEHEDLNENNGTSNDGQIRLQRLFTILMASINLNGTSKNRKSQRVELIVRLNGLFQFGNSYLLKIISSTQKKEEDGKKTVPRPLIAIQTRIKFAKLPDELDTAICPHERGINDQNVANNNEFDLELLAQRQALASRWTGSFRSVEFFPLHSVINVTFFGAPPSHCIPGYRVQLWLLNSFQTEKFIRTKQLVREGPGIFVGAVEFRELLKGDGRLKYRIKLLPIEQWEGNNGDCVCKLEGKCGCIQVYTNSFTMLNSIDTDSTEPTALAPPDESVTSSDTGGRSPLTILLACLLLALTLVLLSFALLLLILRNNRMGRKRRTLLIFRKSEKGGEKLDGLVGGRKSHISNRNASSAIPNIKSVLILNAQPGKRLELERFARLLVKNGVRVFYDRWDRVSIERNLQNWVHQAITKAEKAVLFWDHRAEKLLNPLSADNIVKQRIPKNDGSNSDENDNDDLFDLVFCALHQQLDPEKTIYVKWDESTQMNRPIGSISETIFLFHRDLKLIYAALKIPITEQELREFEHWNNRTPQNRPESLLVLIPKFAKKKVPEKVELLTHIEGNNDERIINEETLPERNDKEKDEGIYSGTFSENLIAQQLEIIHEKEIKNDGKIVEKIGKHAEQNEAQFDSVIESALHL